MTSFKHIIAIGALAIAGSSFAGDRNQYPNGLVEGASTDPSCTSNTPEETLRLQYRTQERTRFLCEQSNIVNERNIWQILADYNRDNSLSDDDIGLISGKQLVRLLSDTEGLFKNQNQEQKLYQNFSWILAQGGYPVGDILTKSEFIQKIKEHYRGIPAFQNGIETVIQSGIPLEYALYYGKDAPQKWKEARSTLCSDKDIGELYCMIQDDITRLPSQLDTMRKAGKITEEEYGIKKSDLAKIIRDGSLEQDIFKEILGLLPALSGVFVAGKYPLFYRTGSSMPLKKDTIQSTLGIGVGINNGDNKLDKGGFIQGGLNTRLGINENGELQLSVGVFQGTKLTLPSLQLMHTKMTGYTQIKESPIPDTSKILTSRDIGGGFDFFGPYLKYQQNDHRIETMSMKESYFDALLSTIFIFRPNFSLKEYMEYLSEKLETMPQLSYLIPMLPNILSKLESMGYDGKSPENTQEILHTLRKSIVSEFYAYALYSSFTETHIAGKGVKARLGMLQPTFSTVWAKKTIHPHLPDEVRSEAITRNNLTPTFQKTLSKEGIISWFSQLSPDISVSEKDGIISLQSRIENEELLSALQKSGINLKHVPGSLVYNFDGKVLSFGNIEKIQYHHIYRTIGESSEIILGEGKNLQPLEIKQKITQLVTPFNTTQLYQGTSIISGKPNVVKNEFGF